MNKLQFINMLNVRMFYLGDDEITMLLIKKGADFYLRDENWASSYFGCITRNGKVNLKEYQPYIRRFFHGGH